jgi:TolB-like protein
MADLARAVFLSYASQDAEAAKRICESLRAAGIEVWFDQNELRGGDVWDQKIRQQIHDCALFVPIISANTESRTEGYFRLEWKLAVDRSHLMADDAAFLFPVVIDDTPDQTARVPDKFRSVQWTRLPAGAAPAAFSQRVAALLCGSAKPVHIPEREPSRPVQPSKVWAIRGAIIALIAVAAGITTWLTLHRAPTAVAEGPKAAVPVARVAPAHSIAVLPFADMSAGRDQEYFSDGLAEELLNLLSKVPGLQVAARTSAFSFKGHSADIPTIGRQLVVANVLEGSVRKIGNHLRITAQLVRVDNGYEVWSEIYDRELGDVFRIQDEIAAHVVKALQLKLLGAEVPHSASTQNTDAYLVFLQGRAKMASQRLVDFKSATADFERAIKLDPGYAPAYVELATAKVQLAEFEVTENRPATANAAVQEAKLLIERALALDPRNAQAYIERGHLRTFSDDLKGAEQDYRKGIELDPNSARGYAELAYVVYEDPRRRGECLTLLAKAAVLDPLDAQYDVLRAQIMWYAHSDTSGAYALLSEVVARHPQYQPALWRLAELRRTTMHFADAVLYGEQALKLDPLQEWPRLSLINSYVDLGEIDAARAVADEAPNQMPIDRIRLLVHDGEWHRAAEAGYAAMASKTMPEMVLGWVTLAMRVDARATNDFARARAALEHESGVTWSAQGVPTLPTLPTQMGEANASVGLAAVLIASGERDKGERLLRASLADMNHVARDLGRGDFWYVMDQAIANALLGDRKATIAALRRALTTNSSIWAMDMDPARDLVRGDPEYQALLREYRQQVALGRQALERLRAEGRVPMRGKPARGTS